MCQRKSEGGRRCATRSKRGPAKIRKAALGTLATLRDWGYEVWTKQDRDTLVQFAALDGGAEQLDTLASKYDDAGRMEDALAIRQAMKDGKDYRAACDAATNATGRAPGTAGPSTSASPSSPVTRAVAWTKWMLTLGPEPVVLPLPAAPLTRPVKPRTPSRPDSTSVIDPRAPGVVSTDLSRQARSRLAARRRTERRAAQQGQQSDPSPGQ